MRKRILLAALVSLLLMSGLGFAGVPGLPCQFYGSVSYNDAPAPDGLVVKAFISGQEIASSTTKDGKYSLIIKDPDGKNSGRDVTFSINSIDASKTGTFCSGCIRDVPLSVTGPALTTPSTGSGSTSTSSGGSSGGSSGSVPVTTTTSYDASESESVSETDTFDTEPSSETKAPEIEYEEPACVEKWICTDWTDCRDGITTRKCADKNECGTEDSRPFESEPCSVQEENTSSTPTGFAAVMESKRLEILGIGGIVVIILIAMLRYSQGQSAKKEDDETPRKKAGLVTSKKNTRFKTQSTKNSEPPPKKEYTKQVMKVKT